MALIQGDEGSITTGTGTPVTVAYISEWEATLATEIKEQGPWIGDGTKQKVRGAKGCKGTMKGMIPNGRDPGQTSIVTAHEGGADLALTLTTDNGYILALAAAVIEDLKVGQKGDEGAPFECSFSDNGGYTYTPDTP
jgi:hypothetical protein